MGEQSIFSGDADDPTNAPEEFDATARFLIRCGVLPLDESDAVDSEVVTDTDGMNLFA